jgi:hypothetical protein
MYIHCMHTAISRKFDLSDHIDTRIYNVGRAHSYSHQSIVQPHPHAVAEMQCRRAWPNHYLLHACLIIQTSYIFIFDPLPPSIYYRFSMLQYLLDRCLIPVIYI